MAAFPGKLKLIRTILWAVFAVTALVAVMWRVPANEKVLTDNIYDAFKRNKIDSKELFVQVSGRDVVVTGAVRDGSQRDYARTVVMSGVPHLRTVRFDVSVKTTEESANPPAISLSVEKDQIRLRGMLATDDQIKSLEAVAASVGPLDSALVIGNVKPVTWVHDLRPVLLALKEIENGALTTGRGYATISGKTSSTAAKHKAIAAAATVWPGKTNIKITLLPATDTVTLNQELQTVSTEAKLFKSGESTLNQTDHNLTLILDAMQVNTDYTFEVRGVKGTLQRHNDQEIIVAAVADRRAQSLLDYLKARGIQNVIVAAARKTTGGSANNLDSQILVRGSK